MNTDLPTTRELLNESADLLERAVAFRRKAGGDASALELLVGSHREWAAKDLNLNDQRGCLCNSQGILHPTAEVIRKLNITAVKEKEEQERLAASLEEQLVKTQTKIRMVHYRPENRTAKTKQYYPAAFTVVVIIVIVIAMAMAS